MTPAEQGSDVPLSWKPTLREPIPVVRCTATSNGTGERCNRWSLRGTTVCWRHGGHLPGVQEHAAAVVEAARLELFGNSARAVEVLLELMNGAQAEGVRLKAATEVLDRSGVRGGTELDVQVTDGRVDAAALLRDKVEQMRARVIEGEVVPPDACVTVTPSTETSEETSDG